MNKKVEFNFNLHIPYVLSNCKVFDVGKNLNFKYFDEKKTEEIINLFSNMSYLKINKILYNLIKIHKKKFKFSLCITGVSIEIMKKFNPQLLESFKKLIGTGQVELKSSFYHSLNAPKVSKLEILDQIKEHEKIIFSTFNVKPTNFAKDFVNFSTFPINSKDIIKKVLINKNEITKLNFNYDFFGIKHDENSGVFQFLKYLPTSFLNNDFEFVILDNENLKKFNENKFENLNLMQQNLSQEILDLEEIIKSSGNIELIENWKRLSSFDYINNLDFNSFKENSKNNFLAYQNSYDLFINIKNILEDMNSKLHV